MLVLHTSDWHAGRTIRGRSRADEHRAVLNEITQIAEAHSVDVVIVAGDQFDVQGPSAESEQIVWGALTALANVAPVVVVAGNHDNPRRLDALTGLLTANDIHAVGTVTRPEDGGVVRIGTKDGVTAHVALLPFVHHRSAVNAADLLDPDQHDGEYGSLYANQYHRYIAGLSQSMALGDDSAVNIVVGHATCLGGVCGGGEREVHSIMRYFINPKAFPSELDYVALGHLHKSQLVSSDPPVMYSGAPMMMDFGESDKPCSVVLAELNPGHPAKIETVPIRSGRPLRTITGTVDQVMATPVPDNDPWIRVLLTGDVPAGIAEVMTDRFGPRVVDVRVTDRSERRTTQSTKRTDRTPRELVEQYLEHQGIDDPRLGELFDTLVEEIQDIARETDGIEG